MKKLAAIFLFCAVAVSFSACHSKKDMTEEEYSKYVAAEQSKRVAESEEAEAKVSEGWEDVSDDVGKTIKGKKVVAFSEKGYDKEYVVVMMDKNGNGDYRITYHFAPDLTAYNKLIQKGEEENKLYKKDKASRMVAFKETDIQNNPFEDYYKRYDISSYWQIVE